MQVTIPAVIGRALTEKGYNRAEIFLTGEGILLKPLHSEERSRRQKSTATLPDWS